MSTSPAIRRLRRQIRPPAESPAPSWRQGIITARDAASLTCSVDLGGDVPVTGVAVPGHLYPMVGATCWLARLPGEPGMLVGIQGGVIGAARVRAATHADIAPLTITPISHTTAERDSDGLWSAGAPTRLTLPWPGWYDYGGNVESTGGSTAGVRRLASIRLNSSGTTDTGWIGRTEVPSIAPPNAQAHPIAEGRWFAAGDWIELTFYQAGGGNLAITKNTWTPVLWAMWRGLG